jgi:predicted acetyltransferase
MSAPTVRTIRDDELGDFIGVVRTAFLSPPPSDVAVESRREVFDMARCLGAYDGGGRLRGVARSFATPFTVPGGEVTAGAVSAVGVLPTHTRQGHLSRMMRTQLADSAERGEPVAVLIAAEYPIYGRYGYGPGTRAAGLRVDAITARWIDEPAGTIELVDNETYAKEIDQLYDATRRLHPGHIGRTSVLWQVAAGVVEAHEPGDEDRRGHVKIVWRDGAGDVRGAASYSAEESWVDNRPSNALRAETFVAGTARAEHELLRFLAGTDWVTRVDVGMRPVDDPAPLALVDGRAAVVKDISDHTWVRVIDVPAALGARTYAGAGSLVLEVDDPLGHAQGRFRLDAGPDGAACAPTTDEPDLTLPVGALGAAYLGGHSWSRLGDAGWVEARRPGALETASALFSTPRAPWGSLMF